MHIYNVKKVKKLVWRNNLPKIICWLNKENRGLYMSYEFLRKETLAPENDKTAKVILE